MNMHHFFETTWGDAEECEFQPIPCGAHTLCDAVARRFHICVGKLMRIEGPAWWRVHIVIGRCTCHFWVGILQPALSKSSTPHASKNHTWIILRHPKSSSGWVVKTQLRLKTHQFPNMLPFSLFLSLVTSHSTSTFRWQGWRRRHPGEIVFGRFGWQRTGQRLGRRRWGCLGDGQARPGSMGKQPHPSITMAFSPFSLKRLMSQVNTWRCISDDFPHWITSSLQLRRGSNVTVKGERLTEAVHINKSLFSLQGVVAALADGLLATKDTGSL